MMLAQFTEPNLLLPHMVSEGREAAIIELSGRLENAGRVEDANAFALAVLKHDSQVSAVFDAVAFPLARVSVVKELSFAFGLSQRGMLWGTGKAPIVHAVILFAVPISAGQDHLSLVVTFSKLLNDKMTFSALQRCAQPAEMFIALQQVHILQTGSRSEATHH